MLLRPDDDVHDDASLKRAEVVHKAFRGAEILYTLRLGNGRRVLALVPSHHNHALGERIDSLIVLRFSLTRFQRRMDDVPILAINDAESEV